MNAGPFTALVLALLGQELVGQTLSVVREWVTPKRATSLILQAGNQSLVCPDCTCNCDSPGSLQIILLCGSLLLLAFACGLGAGRILGPLPSRRQLTLPGLDDEATAVARRRGGGRLV